MLKKLFAAFAVAALATSMVGCVTIVKTGEEHTLTGETAFDAGDDVSAIWDSQVIPELTTEAVELTTLLELSAGDLSVQAEEWGHYSMGTSGELSYVVRGTGRIVEVEDSKKAGYAVVQLDGYTGSEEIRLQIGTVYKGSAVRDCLSFIKFEDYTNQVDYAAVSQSLHDMVQAEVIDAAGGSLEGKAVTFVGCFTVDGNDVLLITPVALEVE